MVCIIMILFFFSDEFWVGGIYYIENNAWVWKTASGNAGNVDEAWGVNKPVADLDKKCVNLYKDSQNGDLYSLRNALCNGNRKFICERDFVDVTLKDWFTLNSTVETREMTYVVNPTLSWEKAQVRY